MQHQFITFHSTVFHTKRGQLFVAHGTRRHDFDSKFSKFFRGDTPHFIAVEGLPIPELTPSSPRRTAPSLAGRTQVPHCWYPDHRAHSDVSVPHLCPCKNNLLAPPLNRIVTAEQLRADMRHRSSRTSLWTSLQISLLTNLYWPLTPVCCVTNSVNLDAGY